MKNYVYNQTSKIFFWNLQQMGKVTRLYCWHQDFVHKGLSALGLYTCIKSLKMCINQISKRLFWNLQHRAKRKDLSVVIKILSPRDCLPLPGAIHMVKPEKNVYKIGLQSNFVFNLQQMGKVIRAFCWHQKFVPKGLSSLALGLYTYIKSLNMCLKSDFFF